MTTTGSPVEPDVSALLSGRWRGRNFGAGHGIARLLNVTAMQNVETLEGAGLAEISRLEACALEPPGEKRRMPRRVSCQHFKLDALAALKLQGGEMLGHFERLDKRDEAFQAFSGDFRPGNLRQGGYFCHSGKLIRAMGQRPANS